MNKYYLIPTLDRGIFFNNEELQAAICNRSKKIKQLESKRISLIYSGPIDEDMSPSTKIEYAKTKRLIKEQYKKESYPEYLLVTKNVFGYKEIASQKEIKFKEKCYIEIREVPEEVFKDYIESNPEYPETINHLLEPVKENKIINFIEAKKRYKK